MAGPIWQDRDIRFDVPKSALALRRGEEIIDYVASVEDTKGNNGERGQLSITNMRLIWASTRSSVTNLSIGYACVTNLKIRTASSRLRGNTQALYIMTKFNKASFEFIFTSLVKSSPRLFVTVQAVFRSYETTRLYRDLKLRGAIVKNKELIMLPHEQVYSKVPGVWNLSSNQGNLGTFFITNVRLVWHANLAENFNVSMPYMQMKSIKIRDSKFGPALVIETTQRSGGYVLGFKMDPPDKLKSIHKEVTSLHQVFSVSPIFGVEYKVETGKEEGDDGEMPSARTEDGVEIIDDENQVDHFSVYYADGGKSGDREPVFDPGLGLAVEALPEGFTTSKLWSVVA